MQSHAVQNSYFNSNHLVMFVGRQQGYTEVLITAYYLFSIETAKYM